MSEGVDVYLVCSDPAAVELGANFSGNVSFFRIPEVGERIYRGKHIYFVARIHWAIAEMMHSTVAGPTAILSFFP